MTYNVTHLGSLSNQQQGGAYNPFCGDGKTYAGTQANAINDTLIVGGSRDAAENFRAVYWDLQDPTTIRQLSEGWTANSIAYGADTDGVNDPYFVGGTQQVVVTPKNGYAFYWYPYPPLTMVNLTPPVSSRWDYLFRLPTGIARGIRVSKSGIDVTSGIIVGEWTPPSLRFFPASRQLAVYWPLGISKPTRLPQSALRQPTTAAAINIRGAIVGQEDSASGTVGCLWRNAGSPPEDLPSPKWLSKATNTSPWAINDSGLAVGTCGSDITPGTLMQGQIQFPCLWKTSTSSSQATGKAFFAEEKPSAKAYGFAYGINNKNVIVGKYYLNLKLLDLTLHKFLQTRAFICGESLAMIDLNKLVDPNWRGPDGNTGWVLEEARSINDDGKIVCFGHPPNASAPHRSFLLTPT